MKRNSERGSCTGVRLGAGPVIEIAQPGPTGLIVYNELGRNTREGVYGSVHDSDLFETHRLDLFIRECFTDHAGDFGVRGLEPVLGREDAGLFGERSSTIEECAPEDSNLGRYARRRVEILGTEHALGMASDPKAFLLETFDPLLARGAVARDREVDDAVLLPPMVTRLLHLLFFSGADSRLDGNTIEGGFYIGNHNLGPGLGRNHDACRATWPLVTAN